MTWSTITGKSLREQLKAPMGRTELALWVFLNSDSSAISGVQNPFKRKSVTVVAYHLPRPYPGGFRLSGKEIATRGGVAFLQSLPCLSFCLLSPRLLAIRWLINRFLHLETENQSKAKASPQPVKEGG